MVKFIYAGYAKCGTKTMAAAFRELGFNNYDFEETIQRVRKFRFHDSEIWVKN